MGASVVDGHLVQLPALISSGDLLPGGGPLNGRRWAGQTLLRCWAQASGSAPMALAHAQPASLEALLPLLRQAGHTGPLHGLPLTDPHQVAPWGGLFLPDPSIGRWAQWRRPAGAAAFSLIGQIHTLSTPAAQALIQDLVSEPVQPWDALICTSTAGRAVVQALIEDRQQQLLARTGGDAQRLRGQQPQLPVIPLPLEVAQLQAALPSRGAARQALGLPADAAVVLWLGRLSLLTKLDPWPAYALLQRLAGRLGRPLVLIECGPDDSPQQGHHFEQLRQLCPAVRFLRLGGEQPVEESTKHQALAAADLGLFLVDNPQETFGLAVVEAMAAGLPCVASNWDGYRDLLRPGVDGFLIDSRWAAGAETASGVLGWQQFTGLSSFPQTAGALAQLVQLDLGAAEAALEALLADAKLRRAMGAAARQRALRLFDAPVVMGCYQELFAELQAIRAAAPAEARDPQPLPMTLDPLRLFAGFASQPPQEAAASGIPDPPEAVRAFRQSLWQQVLAAAPEDQRPSLLTQLRAKHHQP